MTATVTYDRFAEGKPGRCRIVMPVDRVDRFPFGGSTSNSVHEAELALKQFEGRRVRVTISEVRP
jgi:hypothetical protein